VPNFSTLSRRAQSLELPAQPRATGGPIHLLVDSSGLKLGGPGEWLVEKHGTSKRRSWRKLHIGFDAVTGQIVASILTDRDVDDVSQVDVARQSKPCSLRQSSLTAGCERPPV
jgi:hypothetical protein